MCTGGMNCQQSKVLLDVSAKDYPCCTVLVDSTTTQVINPSSPEKVF